VFLVKCKQTSAPIAKNIQEISLHKLSKDLCLLGDSLPPSTSSWLLFFVGDDDDDDGTTVIGKTASPELNEGGGVGDLSRFVDPSSCASLLCFLFPPGDEDFLSAWRAALRRTISF
jgi:hypothetical protein